MTDGAATATAERVAELERELSLLREQLALDTDMDELLEEALERRLSLSQTLEHVYPLMAERIGLRAARVRTYDEELELRDFSLGDDDGQLAEIVARAAEQHNALVERDAGTLKVAHALDVAGQRFGAAAVLLDDGSGDADGEARVARARALLGVACEELDNHLASIASARRKHQITRALSTALKEPVLDDGIAAAVGVLADAVPFDTLLVVYRHEEDTAGVTINTKVFEGKTLARGSSLLDDDEARGGEAQSGELRRAAMALLDGESDELAQRYGIERYREEALINGVRDQRLIGRVMITRADGGEFNTTDRDLLERFADYLRQRIVDFNREWKSLSLAFDPRTVRALLSRDDYVERYLEPRVADVAVMFCDISGFTRISEQVLRDPKQIGQLIDVWTEQAVELIWQSGGVFDKMVGDCVIGLWGPPLYPWPAREACRRALEAARAIREFTARLGEHAALPALRGVDPPPGVATGLNFCPLFVGRFGPNEDYTGFSSGMNNTARLQGVAARDEILCMQSFVDALDDKTQFGEAREASVKNVAEPLIYRVAR